MTLEMLAYPPVLLLLGAFLVALLPTRLRNPAFLIPPLLALASLWLLPGEADALSRVFGSIFAMITVIGGIYAYHITDRQQQVAALAYAAGAMGVVLVKTYMGLFLFWELMAISSTLLVWANRTEDSARAGMRYLLVHIVGGGLLLAGMIGQEQATGSGLITALPELYTWPALLMLLGVAMNTAIPPLHAWLPDAYPKATITGAVFMSAFTTKSAVYVLMRMFPGHDVLIWFGVAMALYGVVYAVLANDIRQILAYHIISQVGYMVAAVGIGTPMALNGAAAHAFSHILYKSLLFMGAGAVILATGRRKLTELGGIAGRMRWVVALYMIGAFSISGFPLFNGFISKSMIVSAAGEAHLEWVMLLLILASVGTFLHTGLKLPYFTWFGGRRDDIDVGPVPRNMLVAMAMGATLCTLFGVAPDLLYRFLPFETDYEPYTLYHLVEATQILTLTFVGFWLLRKKLAGDPKIALDTDWFYRRPANLLRILTVQSAVRTFAAAERALVATTERVCAVFAQNERPRTVDTLTILAGGLLVFVTTIAFMLA